MLVIRACFLLFIHTSTLECAKILGVFYSTTSSHFMAGSTLMRILAEKGHEVTVLGPYKQKDVTKNYREIYLDGIVDKSHHINFFKTKKNAFSMIWNSNQLTAPLLNKTMSHPKFQELVYSNSTFDAVIIEQFNSDALLYLATHFKAPLIGFSTLDASYWTNRYVGNPTFPSYIADVLFPFDRMNFWERLQNVLLFLLKEIVFTFKTIPTHNKILQDNIPGAPDITEFLYNTSLTFLNTDLAIHDAIPKVPGMIDIGGFHLNPPQTLPGDLQDILDKSENGVILFSLGSSVVSKDMPKDKLDAILETFSKMRETILWKWEDDDLPGKPENVITRKWIPQQDILRHKNVKLFITHGGLFSMMESIYNGVPMLAIPIKADQYSNTARAKTRGYTKSLEFSELTVQSFTETITELLENPEYRRKSEIGSLIMKNKPMAPRDVISFWVENVISNKGAPHLRVASLDMPLYQYMLADVVTFLEIPILIVIFSFVYIVKYFIKLSRRRRKRIN